MKRLLGILLAAVLIFSGTDAYAQKGGRSFSGGSRGGGSYSKPSSVSIKPSTGSSYTSGPKVSSSGTKSYSSGSKAPSVTTAPKASTPNAKSYSSGNKVYTAVPQNQSKPKGGAFDGNAAAAQQRAASKAHYIKGAEPRSSYTTPTGRQVNIDSSSRSVQNIRSMSHTTYISRETRIHTFYSGYYSYPIVVYHDPYNSFFWYWMLDRSFEERALWAYHNRATMDTARYQALLAKDAQLEGRIRQLEAEKRAVDPTYTPTGMTDYDLQFTDDYVDSIYNPHTEHAVTGWFGRLMWWVFMTLLAVTVACILVFLIFIKRWGG